ncbi:HAMP domain-containing histidine kinase [Shewanella sp. AS1]|uniref:ATP-binding protein n=1 Tax=Shewanella sp. AS1 TaxID=2907626 RepID=UPI001F3F3939|nr:HAMP domain-containing sensor histidine kinase [Shewanella sp. AS1]MCE9679819.1 HAMP domain-containing histidine kinase [Shewanella sp. AS1]
MKRSASIMGGLVNSLLAVFSLFIFIIFLVVDLLVDNWADEQFEDDLMSHASYLQNLIKEQEQTATLKIDTLLIKEFADKEHPELSFFQVWDDKKQTLQRSPSLQDFPDVELIRLEQPINSIKLVNVELPNGDSGRAVMSYFAINLPQKNNPVPIYLTVYKSDNALETFLWGVDILLFISFFVAIFIMRTLAIRIVSNGLKPLDFINQQIKSLSLARQNNHNLSLNISPFEPPIAEIEPIRNELNNFIRTNQQLIEKEQRITADIAHELKTPIAEIISLTEVSLNFPDDVRISETYQQDMLKISLRMKKIVDNLLLLQRASSDQFVVQLEEVELEDLLLEVQNSLMFKYPDIKQRVVRKGEEWHQLVIVDYFSLYTILLNLLDNALYYGKDQGLVGVSLDLDADASLTLIVTNELDEVLTDRQLQQLTEPLYQVDSARTEQQKHGLGLSIVQQLCQQNQLRLNIDKGGDGSTLNVAIKNIRCVDAEAEQSR